MGNELRAVGTRNDVFLFLIQPRFRLTQLLLRNSCADVVHGGFRVLASGNGSAGPQLTSVPGERKRSPLFFLGLCREPECGMGSTELGFWCHSSLLLTL